MRKGTAFGNKDELEAAQNKEICKHLIMDQ